MKAITTCVEYDDLLRITLPCNIKYFEEILIVTDPTDTATQSYVTGLQQEYSNLSLLVTDAFHKDDAILNKGAAIEEALNLIGRTGWLCFLDADVILPENHNWLRLHPGFLYSPWRRMLYDPKQYNDTLDWDTLSVRKDTEHCGYCQVFHAFDPHLSGKVPWYSTEFEHAGGCDTYFQNHWPENRKIRPNWYVLHLGPVDHNWCGRVSERLDGREIPEARLRKMFMNQAKGRYPFTKRET